MPAPSRGFSLVEALVAIAIVAIFVPVFSMAVGRGFSATRDNFALVDDVRRLRALLVRGKLEDRPICHDHRDPSGAAVRTLSPEGDCKTAEYARRIDVELQSQLSLSGLFLSREAYR